MNFEVITSIATYDDARGVINFLENETTVGSDYIYTLEYVENGESYFQIAAAVAADRDLTEEESADLKRLVDRFFERVTMTEEDKLLALEVARLSLMHKNNIQYASNELDVREDILKSLAEKLEYHLNG